MPKHSYIGNNPIRTQKVRKWQATKKVPKKLTQIHSDKQTPRIDLHLELEADGVGELQAGSRSRPVVGGGAAVGGATGGVLPWVGTIAAAQLKAVGVKRGLKNWWIFSMGGLITGMACYQ